MILLNLIVKPLWIFGIDRNVQLTVGNTDYGMYFALLNLTFVFSILLDLGITINSSRKVAGNPELLNNLFGNVLWAKIMLMLLYFLVLGICCAIFYNKPTYYYMLGMLAFLQFLNSLLQYLRSNISANYNFKLDSLLSVLDKILVIIVCGIILFSPALKAKFSVIQFIYIQILGYVIAIVVAWLATKQYAQKITFGFNSKLIIPLIKQGLPYTLVVLLMAVYTRSDAFLLERLLVDGKMQSGNYASIYRLLDTCNMFGYLFAGMLLPIFAKLISNGKSVAEMVGTSLHALLPISIGVISFCWPFKNNIMRFIMYQHDHTIAFAFAILMCSFPALCIMNIYSTLLTAGNNIKELLKITAVGAILSLVLNLIFLPTYGYFGATCISLLVQWTVAILYLQTSLKIYALPQNNRAILKFVILLIVLLLCSFGLFYLKIQLIFAAVLFGLIFLILVWALKLWQVNKLAQFFEAKIVN